MTIYDYHIVLSDPSDICSAESNKKKRSISETVEEIKPSIIKIHPLSYDGMAHSRNLKMIVTKNYRIWDFPTSGVMNIKIQMAATKN